MYQNTVFDPSREPRLWDDTGELLGFSWLEEPAGVLMQVHPRLRGSGVLEDEMLDWAARQIRVVYRERAGKELWTRVPEDESLLGEFLFSRGFERDPYHVPKMLWEVGDRTPQPKLPAGWTVCEVGGERDWGERVETHREVWHPSRVTLAA